MKSFLPELVNPRVPGKSDVEQSGVVEPSCGGRGRSESQRKCLNLLCLGMRHDCWSGQSPGDVTSLSLLLFEMNPLTL